MKGILIIISFLVSFCLSAQSWTTFTNHKDVQDIVKEGNTLWVGTNGGLLKWDLQIETHEKYTTSEGLISNRIRQITIDEDKAVWIATSRGISVLSTDGDIARYTTEDGILFNEISSVAIDSEGNKWFGTNVPYETNGLMRLSTDGQWTIFNPEEYLYHTRIEHLAIDVNDNVWIATNLGVLRFNNDETWTVIATYSQTEPTIYADIALDENGEFWGVNNYGGVTHYDFDGNATYYDESDGIPIYALSIFIDEDYNKWISSTLGLSKMDLQNEVSTYPFEKEINTIYVENNKVLGGTEDDIEIFFDGEWERLVSTKGLLSNDVRDVEFAQDGTVLFATAEGIPTFSHENGWSEYSTEDGIYCDNSHTILATTDNQLLISHLYYCFGLNGLSEVDLNSGEGTFVVNDSLVISISLHEDNNGNVWIGYYNQTVFGANALKMTTNGTLIPFDFAQVLPNDQPNNKTLSIEEDINGTIYFSTRGGGVSINAAGEQELFWANPCTATLHDKEGNIWVGEGDYWSPGHMLYKEDIEGIVEEYDIPGLASSFKYQIVEDGEGNIWFATDKGLYKRSLDDEFVHYTTADGLADDDVKAIEFGPDGEMWLATANGVSSSAAFPTSVSSYANSAEGLLVYPNPSTGIFYVELPIEDAKNLSVSVYNNLGQIVYQSIESYTEEIITIELDNQSDGMYCISVIIGQKAYIAKVSKW